jgi:hypothetical protein
MFKIIIFNEINREEVKETPENVTNSTLTPLDQIPAIVSRLKDNLSDLNEAERNVILNRMSSFFQMMRNNIPRGNYKLNLANKMFSKIFEYKQEALIEFLIQLGFKETGKDGYEAIDKEHMRSSMNDTDFVESLKQ